MGIVKLSAPRLSYRLKRAIFAWMWTKGYTVEISVLEYLVFLSWQIQWWWAWMIDTWGFTRCLQVQVQVCWDFCCSGKQKFQTKNQQQHVDSLGKKAPTGPTDVYRLFAPAPHDSNDAHDVEVHRDGSPKWIWTVDAGIRALGWETPSETHPFFFLKQFRKSWNSLLKIVIFLVVSLGGG